MKITVSVLLSGYLAPEYAMRGHLSEKADVFGFGVVALEVVCGRRNTNESLELEKVYLLEWVSSYNNNSNNYNLALIKSVYIIVITSFR